MSALLTAGLLLNPNVHTDGSCKGSAEGGSAAAQKLGAPARVGLGELLDDLPDAVNGASANRTHMVATEPQQASAEGSSSHLAAAEEHEHTQDTSEAGQTSVQNASSAARGSAGKALKCPLLLAVLHVLVDATLFS